MDSSYIQENSRLYKIKTLVISGVSLAVFLFIGIFFSSFLYTIFYSIPFLNRIVTYVIYNFTNTTPIGLFYGHFFGAIFFVPSADELIFYYGLMNGNPFILSFLAAIIGYMLAQLLNYFIGYKMGGFMMHLVSKKKVYKTKRWINKYGAYGIFVFNVLPLPAPLLVFALGVTKYNFKRLLIITCIAKIIEYSFLIAFFLLFSG